MTDPQSPKMPLHRAFTFHFSFYKQLLRSKRITNAVSYASHLNEIATFQTIQEFWSYYQHLIRPEQLPIGCEFFLFEKNVKPMWEDARNLNGGIFRLFVKKQYGNRFWEDLVLGIIGEQCEFSLNITGMGIEVREKECVISIWVDNEVIDNSVKRETVKEWIKKTLGISPQAPGDISWKKHEYYQDNQQENDKNYKKKPFQDYHNETKKFETKKKTGVEELMGRRGDTWRKQNDTKEEKKKNEEETKN